METEQITPELAKAVKALRLRARGGYVSSTAAEKAFVLLDGAGVFAEIDAARPSAVPSQAEVDQAVKEQKSYDQWVRTPK